MTAADLFTYAPEWAETVPVGIVAVSASGSPRHPSTSGLLRRFHPQAAAAALAHLERLGRNPGDYDLVPAHPWQIERRLPARYPAALAEGRIVVAPEACIAARPLLSLRTFAPASDRRSPHLKTSVDVRLTTAVRGVSPAAARNGPLLSRLIAHVCHEEGGFGGRFGVLAELAGGGYRPGPGEPADAAGALSAVVRESPEAGIAGGGVALPTAALAARSPASGRLVLAEVLDEVARGHGGSRADAGARFLSAWCVCALPALLTLLSRWGIGLEAHGENLVAVLADGLAVRMLYRDFGGVRVSPSRLRNQGLRLPALTGALPTDDETELRGKFLFPLLETNLGQIVAALVQAGGCDEERLWRLVARCCRTTYAALAADPRIREQCRRDEEALFGARLPVKAMLRTQLEGTPHDARWVTATNPLAATA
jgi:siderophore synthetase component